MTKKTGAGILWFGLVLFLLAGWGTMGFAQADVAVAADEAAAAESVPAEPVVEPVPVAAPVDAGAANLAALRAASAAAESAVAEPEPLPAPAPRLSPDERLAKLQDADLAALLVAQDDCLQAAEAISAYVPELHKLMRQAFEDARQNDPAIQGLNQQIAELEAQREQLLANHPAVLEKRRAIDQAQQDLLAELRLRTTLEGRIAALSDGTSVPAPAAPAE